eukprot:CAMPEP_0169401752 /NCGR_PEP_ID=MMETSP1017-20121227/54712_1 /TAXON_ID=342587 /ORGANISM="Karlodinium micrum, Strain CCMP2283" /LENGTH=68 /DNA_ID=CAMNT_0009507565 /DNA_START=361 /DNA_END=567 /DNA_ORIENTATION=-
MRNVGGAGARRLLPSTAPVTGSTNSYAALAAMASCTSPSSPCESCPSLVQSYSQVARPIMASTRHWAS